MIIPTVCNHKVLISFYTIAASLVNTPRWFHYMATGTKKVPVTKYGKNTFHYAPFLL